MGVHQQVVAMCVLMPPPALRIGIECMVIVMHVAMMAVVVDVFVVVHHWFVPVVVLVVRAQHEADAGHGDHQRHDLSGGHSVREHSPRHDRADERSRGEHQLTPRRAQVACSGHPQRDRDAVAERSNHQRPHDRPTRRWAIEGKADGQVRAARDHTLGQCDVRRCKLVQVCRDAVVDAPAEACAGDQQRAPPKVGIARPPQHDACDHDKAGARCDTRADVLLEEEVGQNGREDELEVQQQRGGRRRGVRQARSQQDRADRSADHHRNRQPPGASAHRCARRRNAADHGQHRDRCTHVQQARQRERTHVAGQSRGRRCRDAEQDRRRRTAQNAASRHAQQCATRARRTASAGRPVTGSAQVILLGCAP